MGLGRLSHAVVVLTCAACTSPPSEAPEPEAGRRFTDLMHEVGRRFERAGRSARAGRWELAEHDVHEIDEVLEDDLPGAHVPHDVSVDVRALGAAFASSPLEELLEATRTHDPDGFATAFAAAAEGCNACHRAADRGFIVVPTTPGSEVPMVEAIPSPPPSGD